MPTVRESSELKFPNRPPVIGLLPGSRKSEAERNFPGLLQAAEQIRKAFPDAQFLVPTVVATHPVVLAELSSAAPPWIEFQQDAFDEMVPRCDLCLTVSGTATLHVAGFGVPMIVVYRVSGLTWNLVGRWLVRTRTFALVNVLAAGPDASREQHVVPEIIPWLGDPAPIADLAIDYLKNPQKLESQRAALGKLVASLDKPGASMNVARLAMEMLDSREGADAPTSSADSTPKNVHCPVAP
jgi:lipid-A-disaccharide synthase